MIAVATNADNEAAVRARLEAGGASSIDVLTLSSDRSVVTAELADEWAVEPLATALRAEGLLATSRPRKGAARDRWFENTRPLTFRDRVTICPAWSAHDRASLPGLIELGPGGFGNGQHPTTRLVVEELVDRIRGGERVLDVGCGSGVLALCALELGASHAVGVDLMADAVAGTIRNASINGVHDRLEATDAPLETIDTTFDVVVANIARAGIVELADQLIAKVAVGGWLALSGITPSQCAQVTGFLRPLVEVDRRVDGGWSVLVLERT